MADHTIANYGSDQQTMNLVGMTMVVSNNEIVVVKNYGVVNNGS